MSVLTGHGQSNTSENCGEKNRMVGGTSGASGGESGRV